jgi:hypothetical protein
VSFALNGVGLTHANGFTALREITLKAEKGEPAKKPATPETDESPEAPETEADSDDK